MNNCLQSHVIYVIYFFSLQSCTGCETPTDSSTPPLDLDFFEMDYSTVLKAEAEQHDKLLNSVTAATAFPLSPPASDTEQKDTQANTNTQDWAMEEVEVTSSVEVKRD